MYLVITLSPAKMGGGMKISLRSLSLERRRSYHKEGTETSQTAPFSYMFKHQDLEIIDSVSQSELKPNQNFPLLVIKGQLNKISFVQSV